MLQRPRTMHGRQVKVVGYGDAKLLGDAAQVGWFLEHLVTRLGMQQLDKTHIYDVPVAIEKLGREPFEDEGGVTGVVVLSTSHCSIHTWPARDKPFFVLDVYSCRDFDPGLVLTFLRDTFKTTSVRMTDLSSSLAPPDDPAR